MRRVLLVAVLMVFVSGAFGHRGNTVHATAGVYAFIDIPYQGQTVASSNFYVAGWSLNCATGANPPHFAVALWNHGTQSWYFPSGTIYLGLHRPDVAAAYSSTCPGVSEYTGFHIYPDSVPPGVYRLWVSWTDGLNNYAHTPVEVTII
jgi:hypothetical protein